MLLYLRSCIGTHSEALSLKRDNITVTQLFTPSGLYFSIDQNAAVFYNKLGFNTGADQGSQLQCLSKFDIFILNPDFHIFLSISLS